MGGCGLWSKGKLAHHTPKSSFPILYFAGYSCIIFFFFEKVLVSIVVMNLPSTMSIGVDNIWQLYHT